MAIFLLWFSIFSFTVFTVALVICVFRFLRSRQLTQGLYLLLVVVFDLWLLAFTYLFFSDVYLRPLSSGTRMVLGLARTLVSAVILFLYGDLVLRLEGRVPTVSRRWLLLIGRRGLLAAMMAHFSADVVMHAVLPLLFPAPAAG